MKVYSHYEIINGIEYRWRTLLQLGDSWDVCGTVVMKNPGSSNILIKENGKSIPIMDEKLLEHLKVFDHAKSYIGYSWYLFSVDNTMACVGHIFEDYLRVHKNQSKVSSRFSICLISKIPILARRYRRIK